MSEMRSVLPTAVEFVRDGWFLIYSTDSVRWYPEDDPYVLGVIEYQGTFTADGIPQLSEGADDNCAQVANGLALTNPAEVTAMGHMGLYKVWLACQAQEAGFVHEGYAQEVINEVMGTYATKPFYAEPTYWYVVGALVLLGGVLVMKKKK